MVELLNYSDHQYYPRKSFKGLEKLVIFPEGELKSDGIPNGSVWMFNSPDHTYDPRILANDVGCGMSAFLISNEFNYKTAADKVADFMKNKRILGNGNHFVDICGPFEPLTDQSYPGHSVLVIHTDGKSFDNASPKTFEEVKLKTQKAINFRHNLGNDLAKLIGAYKLETLGDWPHNTVEVENGSYVYRKGVIKVTPEKIHMLPMHVGSTILFYTIHKDDIPVAHSMPHASGRRGPTGDFKVSVEKAKEIRNMVYVPELVSDSSLRSFHPDCFNESTPIYRKFGKQMVGLGETRIKAFIGKI